MSSSKRVANELPSDPRSDDRSGSNWAAFRSDGHFHPDHHQGSHSQWPTLLRLRLRLDSRQHWNLHLAVGKSTSRIGKPTVRSAAGRRGSTYRVSAWLKIERSSSEMTWYRNFQICWSDSFEVRFIPAIFQNIFLFQNKRRRTDCHASSFGNSRVEIERKVHVCLPKGWSFWIFIKLSLNVADDKGNVVDCHNTDRNIGHLSCSGQPRNHEINERNLEMWVLWIIW